MSVGLAGALAMPVWRIHRDQQGKGEHFGGVQSQDDIGQEADRKVAKVELRVSTPALSSDGRADCLGGSVPPPTSVTLRRDCASVALSAEWT